jgi:nucleosome assembly protein 1-like 1
MSKQGTGDIPSLSTMSDLGGALPPGNGADRAGLVNILKDKLQHLAGQSSGYLESLSSKVKRRVVVLQELQVCLFDFGST